MQESGSSLSFDALSLPDQQRVFLAFLWRGLVIALCSMIGGAIAGFVLGFVASLVALLAGVNTAAYPTIGRFVGGIAGFIVGCYATWHYVKWLFSARLGNFRLRLVAADVVPPNPSLERP